ncbi:MAG: outer membrane protein assembly factor BamA [Candidatus Neptunochlamydia sp.]|nr:outer membrane protein assembly factor BamA [Candidatus Neptunochlamydia sp.]
MNKKVLVAIALLLFLAAPMKPIFAALPSSEVYENKQVSKITIVMENLPREATFNQERVLSKLRTKSGDPFSQLTFDNDLKALSDEYDRAVPHLETSQGEVYITIKLWQKPMIRAITWSGNTKVKTRSLQRELGIKAHTVFSREEFNRAFTKVKEYYMKKGYFDSQLDCKVIPYRNTNEIDIEITVHEGNSGHIKKICFNGFSKREESAILNLMTTKKYNFFTSWLTSTGNYHEEALEHDKLVIVNYLQNEGYADAQVNIQVKESKGGRLEVYISANKGEIYKYGEINISGNELLTEEQIERVIIIKDGSTFSPEKVRDSIDNIKDLYGKDGYIETDINYSLHLSRTVPVYNVDIRITEGEQFKIGLIRVLGNVSTNKNVILRESLLVPGEVFDSRRLKITQVRLEAMGYFKSVNVYPIKTPEDQELGENYRDVVIEVEETTTGNLSLFFGFSSSMKNLFGGLDLAENNFDHRGLRNFWKGLSNLRGAGEYAHARVQIGKKQQSYTVAWMDPYFRDSLWRFGVDLNYSKTGIQSDNYRVKSFGGSLFGSYPLTSYWTYGWKFRVRNSDTYILKGKKDKFDYKEAQKDLENNGSVTGLSSSFSFDSIDNAYKPHKGFRSYVELELAGVRRLARVRPNDKKKHRIFPFFKFAYLNNYYYPIWSKGTLKLKWEFRFACPFGNGQPDLLPLNERYFLGGETTVRGYRPYILGPHYRASTLIHGEKGPEKSDPKGGISSTLLSIEYNQTIFKMLDLFTFIDGGSISSKYFDIPDLRMSCGAGARIELGNRLPITLGLGYPINPKKRFTGYKENKDGTPILNSNGNQKKKYTKKKDKKIFFISMEGQF